MGNLILCSGNRTTKPYYFTSTGIRVYSIEELCYYIYHHIYFIDEELTEDALFEWIGSELNLTERAQKLRFMKENEADNKSIVTVILCSSDYYTEAEIKRLIKIMEEIDNMSPVLRNCFRAKSYLKNNQYIEAASEYEHILNTKEAQSLTPKEYGDILHDLAVAKAHIYGVKEAVSLFKEAYERNQNKDSLYQYLYALLITNQDEQLNETIKCYQIDEETLNALTGNIKELSEEAGACEGFNQINQLRNYKVQGKTSEFYHLADEMIEIWKLQFERY